jgi:hypothetical protein
MADVNPPNSKFRINIGELPLFMLSEMEMGQYINKRVAISN